MPEARSGVFSTEHLNGAASRGSSANDTERKWKLHPVGVSKIFAPLPPVPWLVPSLKLAPGRPSLFCGYGFSGKTITLQSMALSVAYGQPVWGEFACRQGKVLHLDYEMGEHLAFTRYQRLARGMGLDISKLGENLYFESYPQLFLDEHDAEEELVHVAQGFALIVVDAFVAALTNTEENSAAAGRPLYMLARVSQRTGACVCVIHHARKPSQEEKERDPVGGARMAIRGSGAIYGASDGVFVLGATKGCPTRVQHEKEPITGELLDDFLLDFEDINDRSGLRVKVTDDPQRSNDVGAAIVFAITGREDLTSVEDVAKAASKRRDTVGKELRRLQAGERPVVVRDSKGAFRLRSEVRE